VIGANACDSPSNSRVSVNGRAAKICTAPVHVALWGNGYPAPCPEMPRNWRGSFCLYLGWGLADVSTGSSRTFRMKQGGRGSESGLVRCLYWHFEMPVAEQ